MGRGWLQEEPKLQNQRPGLEALLLLLGASLQSWPGATEGGYLLKEPADSLQGQAQCLALEISEQESLELAAGGGNDETKREVLALC